jgi:hypothetical protein
MLGLETTHKSPAVDNEIPSFDSSRAGEYPFKCLIRSAVGRACIDRYKAEDVSFVVTYIFSGVLSGQDDFLFAFLVCYFLVSLAM